MLLVVLLLVVAVVVVSVEEVMAEAETVCDTSSQSEAECPCPGDTGDQPEDMCPCSADTVHQWGQGRTSGKLPKNFQNIFLNALCLKKQLISETKENDYEYD